MERDPRPFGFDRLAYIRDTEASRRLNDTQIPMMIISASGMATAGRILHHLRHTVEDPKDTVLMVGYCAPGTLGRDLIDGKEEVRIFGKTYRVRAQVVVMNSYSAHADEPGLLAFIGRLDPDRLRHVFLVHGDPERQERLGLALTAAGYPRWSAPARGEAVELKADPAEPPPLSASPPAP
jgi:metallo-beta-lactamase family protein